LAQPFGAKRVDVWIVVEQSEFRLSFNDSETTTAVNGGLRRTTQRAGRRPDGLSAATMCSVPSSGNVQASHREANFQLELRWPRLAKFVGG
jgi:hypothetical protein